MSYTDHTPSPPPIDEVTTDLIGVPDIGDDETFAELIGYGSSPIESLRNAWRCEIGWLFAILSNTNPLPGTSMSVFPYQTTASQPILAIYEDFFITPNLDVAWRVRSTDWKKTPYVVSPAQCDYVNRHASSPTLADHVETDLVEIQSSFAARLGGPFSSLKSQIPILEQDFGPPSTGVHAPLICPCISSLLIQLALARRYVESPLN